MENILKEINIKIKEIAQSEEIDTQKLTELISMRDKLKGYNTTNVSQIQGFNTQPVSTYPILGNMRQNQGNSLYDSVTDIANVYLKNQAKQFETKNVNDLIYYHKFISELETSADMTITNKRFEIKNEIEDLIMKEFKNTINERKNKDKDKILETTVKVKDTLET